MTSESKPTYNCRYCNKEFRKETTLTAHLCEQKRRAQQETETGVQWGLRSYLRFFELTQGTAKNKTYADFAASPYYAAFVKFGRQQVEIRNINVVAYTDWLLKNNKKLDLWCKDSFYAEWLHEYIRKESVQDALERALKEMQDYADDHEELKNGFSDYFRYGNSNRICHHISTGRISPWVVFGCNSGIAFLESLDGGQLNMIMHWIDPDYWQRKLSDHAADAEWVRHVLEAARL